MNLKTVLVILCVTTACRPNDTSKERAGLNTLGSDDAPIKLMDDTLRNITDNHPLLIKDRAASDTVQIFPYSLLFAGELFDTFIVSFNDFSPTIITLDKHQLVLDSMGLIGNLKKATPEYRQVKYARIGSLSNIVVTDSTYHEEPDGKKLTENRPGFTVVSVATVVATRYRIDAAGKILKID